jgi:hypothetical protein
MALFELQQDRLRPIDGASLADRGVKERADLQRLLRTSIDAVAPGTLLMAEEFSEWEDSRRRIDLLCLDEEANLVVVELKRGEDGGHMDLQAIRYASMVSAMTFATLVEAHKRYLAQTGANPDEAERRILDFLGWDAPHEDLFCRRVRIVLVAADFSRELTTAVLWLNNHDLDITCVRLRPHDLDGRIVLDVQQVIPLPEASEFQVRMREKAIGVREAVREQGAWSGYWFVNVGEGKDEQHRCWEDCREHGYMLAGGNRYWSDQLLQLNVGDPFFAYLNGQGYVGYGEVLGPPVMQRDFVIPGTGKRLVEMPLRRKPNAGALDDPDRCDYCVPVRWRKTLGRDQAVRLASRRQAVCKLRDPVLVDDLKQRFVNGDTA